MITKIYEDILLVAKSIKTDINVFFYNDAVNNFYQYGSYTDKNGNSLTGWLFTGYNNPNVKDGGILGFYLSTIDLNTDTSGFVNGRVLDITFRYSELLDSNIFNPNIIQDRGYDFIMNLLDQLRKCGRYVASNIRFNLVDLEDNEQMASVYCSVQLTYIKKKNI